MHKSKIFSIWLLGFLVGIFYQSFWSLDLFLFWLVLVFSLSLFLIGYKNKNILAWSFLGIFFLLGVGRVEVELGKIREIEKPQKEINGIFKIIKEPEKKEFYQNLVVVVEDKFILEKESTIERKVLIRADLFREFRYGDEIKLRCQPELVENSSENFDYKMYLAKDEIYYFCKKAEVGQVTGNKGGFYGFILKNRKIFEEKINQIIPEPEASLANGLIFGGNRLSKEKQEIFSRTGMTHIVAVSGYNVTIIAQYLMLLGIFLGLWRKQAFYLAFLGIILFVAMIGFPSSAVRAGMMGLLILWAIKNGRLASADNAILLAGVIMLFINPLLLRWDIGFQLSFLATLGLVRLSPLWEKFLIGRLKLLGFWEIILMTISAQVFVLPIILYNFHSFSLISILANVLVLPIVPLTMLFVFLAMFFGFIFYPLGLIFGWIGYFLLKYEITIIDFLSRFKWSAIEVNGFSANKLILWYLILGMVVYYVNKKRNGE